MTCKCSTIEIPASVYHMHAHNYNNRVKNTNKTTTTTTTTKKCPHHQHHHHHQSNKFRDVTMILHPRIVCQRGLHTYGLKPDISDTVEVRIAESDFPRQQSTKWEENLPLSMKYNTRTNILQICTAWQHFVIIMHTFWSHL